MAGMIGFGRSRRQGRTKRPAFALVALLAIFLQAFVVQTHVHGPSAFAAGYEQRADGGQHVEAAGEHQVSCALCQALASAGAATLPGNTWVLAAERANEVAAVALALAPRRHTHSWQSRAPPSFL
jgi:hypothetical protein